MSEHIPTGAYRLQLHAGFTFGDAQEVVPYLAELGVSHLYLSPVLQAAPGSMHGYDVVDHATVSHDLGGRAGLEQLAAAAHEHGLGLLVDVVPNHMAVPQPAYLNKPLWDVLRHGRGSAYAPWFDVDWDHDPGGGRLGLPVLGDDLPLVLAAGELRLETDPSVDGQVVRYFDQVFPVAPGTEGDDVARVLQRQHYHLACWREKDGVLNYRRFFDVDTLIAVRVELPDVFDATHATLLDLYAAGVVDGFRIDHPDGLADPEGYLARLADATDDGWVVVEKILEGDERLPSTWRTAGTTGYDGLSAIQRALVPPTGKQLDTTWRTLAGDGSLADVELDAKRQVVTTLLAPEVTRLERSARPLLEPAAAQPSVPVAVDGRAPLRQAIEELLVHAEVYRAYLRPGVTPDLDQLARLEAMVARAQASRPDLSTELDGLHRLLFDVDTDDPRGRDLLVRFQQVCGPVMAKGVEDTTFYRYNRMLALNEVGGDPDALTDAGPERLHAWAADQQAHHPTGLTTLSTHDTKRSEDVRARLLALAADPDAWDSLWSEVSARAGEHVVDGPTAYLVFQTVVGAWPISAERLCDYLVKAMREAKRHTTWTDPDESYEGRVLDLARRCLTDPALTSRIVDTLADHADAIAATTLAAKLLQLTLPGVPDVYQGCESLSLTLVDPDNRRPVDYRALRLSRTGFVRVDGAGELRAWSDESLAEAKVWVTTTTLRLRRERPELFGSEASYRPIDGSRSVIGFSRTYADEVVATVVRATGHGADPDLRDAHVDLPDGAWTDVLTGSRHPGGRRVAAELFATLPVALLVRSPGGDDAGAGR